MVQVAHARGRFDPRRIFVPLTAVLAGRIRIHAGRHARVRATQPNDGGGCPENTNAFQMLPALFPSMLSFSQCLKFSPSCRLPNHRHPSPFASMCSRFTTLSISVRLFLYIYSREACARFLPRALFGYPRHEENVI